MCQKIAVMSMLNESLRIECAGLGVKRDTPCNAL